MTYNPTKVFLTFPFPDSCESNEAPATAGRTYYDFRAALMVANNEGLTKTYNRFHDPDETDPNILKLRELHAAMDRAVLDAYGWPDIPNDCEFLLEWDDEDADTEPAFGKARRRKKPWRLRWPDDIRDEVLARLLALNAERAAEEERQGLTGSRATKLRKPRSARKEKGTDAGSGQETLDL